MDHTWSHTTEPWGPSPKQQEPRLCEKFRPHFSAQGWKVSHEYTSKMPFDHPAYTPLKNAALGQNSHGTVFTHRPPPDYSGSPAPPLQPAHRQGTREDRRQAGLRHPEAWVLPSIACGPSVSLSLPGVCTEPFWSSGSDLDIKAMLCLFILAPDPVPGRTQAPKVADGANSQHPGNTLWLALNFTWACASGPQPSWGKAPTPQRALSPAHPLDSGCQRQTQVAHAVKISSFHSAYGVPIMVEYLYTGNLPVFASFELFNLNQSTGVQRKI